MSLSVFFYSYGLLSVKYHWMLSFLFLIHFQLKKKRRQFLPTRDSILLIKFQTHAHKKKLGGGNWLFYRLFLFFLRSKIFQIWLERGGEMKFTQGTQTQNQKKKTSYLRSGTWFLIKRNEFVRVFYSHGLLCVKYHWMLFFLFLTHFQLKKKKRRQFPPAHAAAKKSLLLKFQIHAHNKNLLGTDAHLRFNTYIHKRKKVNF